MRTIRIPRSIEKSFQMLYLPTFLVLLYTFLPPSFMATASQSTYTSIASAPGCASSPGCPDCGGCSCTYTVAYCVDGFSLNPTVNNITVSLIPFINNYQDPVSSICSGDNGTITCNGGNTLCKVNLLPTSYDNILKTWASGMNERKILPANPVRCDYYDPQCTSCCTNYVCNCFACPPPVPT